MKLTLAATLFVSVLAFADPPNEPVVAWVTHCSGDFEDRTQIDHPEKIPCNSLKTAVWLPLTKDSTVFPASKKTRQWIEIRIAHTGERRRFYCDKPGECDPPPIPFAQYVPRAKSADLLQVFLQDPGIAYSRMRLLLSRRENEENGRVTMDHNVVSVANKLQLRNLIRPTAASGEYLVELCPFNERTGCPDGQKPLAIKWSTDSAAAGAVWPGPMLQAGLYEVVLSKNIHGQTLRTPDRGMLLISPEARAHSDAAAVKVAEEMFLHNWHDKSEGRIMFQSFLLDLAMRAAATAR